MLSEEASQTRRTWRVRPHGGSAQQVPIDRKVLVREDVKDHALDGRGAGVEKRARSRAVGTMPRTTGPTVWMTSAAGRL